MSAGNGRATQLQDDHRYPLAWMQQWSWVSQGSISPPPWMIMQRSLELPAGVGRDRVADVVGDLLRRHSALRMRFSTGPHGEPGWTAASDTLPELREVSMTAPEVEAARKSIAQSLNEPFDLESELPVRATIMLVDGVPTSLHLAFHHLVADTTALDTVRSELIESLHGSTASPTPPDDERWTPVRQVEWEHSDAGRGQDLRARAHWNALHRRQSYDLPPLRFGPMTPSGYRISLGSDELAATLGEFSRRHRCSVPATLLTAIGISLANSRGRDTVLFRPLLSNRSSPSQAGYVGSQMNGAWLLLDFNGDVDFPTLARKTGMEMLQAMRRSAFNVGSLIMERVADDVNGNFTGAYMFNYRRRDSIERADGTGMTVEEFDHSPGEKIDVNASAESIEIAITSSADLLGFDEAHRILSGLPELIQHVLSAPGTLKQALPGTLPPRAQRSEGWVDIRGRWIYLPDLEDLLLRMPEIKEAKAFQGDWEDTPGQLICALTVSREVDPAIIFERLRSEPVLAVTVVVPDVLCISVEQRAEDGLGTTRREPRVATRRQSLQPSVEMSDVGLAERALIESFIALHPDRRPDRMLSYAASGGSYEKLPAMREELKARGFIGLDVWDLLTTESLRLVANRLRPTALPTGGQRT